MPGAFDVVLSCDNSLPHLLTDNDLRLALTHMNMKLDPGALMVIGIRDYDALARERPRFTPPRDIDMFGDRSLLFQLWDWTEDGSRYETTLFVHEWIQVEWTSQTHTATYRALKRDDLDRLAAEAGFDDIRWHFPDVTGHHQPLMTARKSMETKDIHGRI